VITPRAGDEGFPGGIDHDEVGIQRSARQGHGILNIGKSGDFSPVLLSLRLRVLITAHEADYDEPPWQLVDSGPCVDL